MTQMVQMTQRERQRTISALDETNRLLAREQAYLPHLQKQDRIAEYERHIAKLVLMLESNEKPDPWIK